MDVTEPLIVAVPDAPDPPVKVLSMVTVGAEL
jgi:hypothetical protein